METQSSSKIWNLQNLQQKKWYAINYKKYTDYGKRDEDTTNIKFETKVIKSNLCDYLDSYILETGDITARDSNANTRLEFKNGAPFTKCITRINDNHVGDATYLDIIMPMYNLIEYNDNYPDTSRSL